MAYGDGSITQVSRGIWKVRVDFGKDPITGKRQVVSRNVRGTKAEARKVRDQIRKEHESGIKAGADKIALAEFVEIWAEAKLASGVATAETVNGNLSRLSHVLDYIGALPVAKIDASIVERTYAKIRDEHGLGGTSMNQIHTLLKSVLNKAVDYDIILRNPCNRVAAPKKDEPDRKALNETECVRLVDCLNETEESYYRDMTAKEMRMSKLNKTTNRTSVRGLGKMGYIQAVRIALATGMRRGELAGLEWQHVNLQERTITVEQSRTKHNVNKAPKTKAGIRTIHVDNETVSHLERWKHQQADALLSLGIKQEDTTPVCCTDKGDYMDLRNFERFWDEFRKANDFDDLKLHELRHTQATQLLANGIDVKTVQARMGHSNASTTLNWYAHAVPENDEKAADLVGSLLSGGPIPKLATA